MNHCCKCGAVAQLDVRYISNLTSLEDNCDLVESLQKRCRICLYSWSEPCLDAPLDEKKSTKEHILD